MTRDEIKSLLESGVCEVTFTKLDGTQRVMPCTLKQDVIPAATKADAASQKRVRELNNQVLIAWATDKNAWRSFRVESVKSVTPMHV
jgi:WYL_2, Sm-like SH3 beta-barrel fold